MSKQRADVGARDQTKTLSCVAIGPARGPPSVHPNGVHTIAQCILRSECVLTLSGNMSAQRGN
jgi:hypothetical protein